MNQPPQHRLRAAGAAPDLDDLAHRRRAPRDARVQRAQRELEAAGLELLRARSPARGSGGPSCRRARCRPRRCPWTSRAGAGGAGRRRRRSGSLAGPRTPPRYVAAGRDVPDAPVQRDVLRAVGAHLDDRAAGPTASARSERGAERRRRRRARSQPQPVERGGVREVEPVRRRDVRARSPSPSPRDRQEVEDPAAVVVDQHDRELAAPSRGRPAAPPTSWASATSPISSTTGPARAGGDAERGRDGAVDAVRAAVGRARAAASSRAGKNVSTSRTGIEEATTSVASAGSARAELGGHARLAQLVGPSVRGDRAGRGAVGRASQRPASRGRRATFVAERVEQRRAGRRRRSCATAPAGSCQAPSGSNATCSASSSPCSHCAQRLGGRQVADAQHEVGRVRRRPTPSSRSSAS